MTLSLSTLQRAWAFGRHIPPRQIARRLTLTASRRFRDMRGPHDLPAPTVRLGDTLPAPLFPPRMTGAVQETGASLTFSFLGRAIPFADGRVSWNAPGTGPEHQLWRMNLHYMEYLEETSDALFAHLVTAWLDSHDTIQPGAWRDAWNSYTLSIRVVVWLQQLARRREALAPALVSRMTESIARQVAFLARNLETDIGGNHLIKNIKALLWASACLEGPATLGWNALGRRLLDRELNHQILPDGVHYERSPAYHTQVFADLLECRAVLSPAEASLNTALNAMAQATADLTHPDGLVAQFGDAGLHMAYAPDACLAAHGALGGARPQPQASFAYETAGYYGHRSDQLYIVVDCGALGPDELPAHAHGDILSFELSVQGKRTIVDQGVYEYIAGERRTLSRAARSHNTLWIDGVDQADFWGAFRLGRRARVTRCSWTASKDGFTLEGAHDGYAAAPGRPEAERRISVAQDDVTIADRLVASEELPASAGFLLHPDIAVEQRDARTALLKRGGTAILQLDCTADLTEEAAVWWLDMGHELPTRRLVAHTPTGRTEMLTRLTLMAGA